MVNHLDEMKFFLEVVDAYSTNIINETIKHNHKVLTEIKEPDILTENTEDKKEIVLENFFNDLTSLKQDWLSLSSEDSDEKFSEGYERGLYKAVEMLENLLLTKYSRRL